MFTHAHAILLKKGTSGRLQRKEVWRTPHTRATAVCALRSLRALSALTARTALLERARLLPHRKATDGGPPRPALYGEAEHRGDAVHGLVLPPHRRAPWLE